MAIATLTIVVLLTIIGMGSIIFSLCCEDIDKPQYVPPQPTQLYDRSDRDSNNINKKIKELEQDIALVNDFLEVEEDLELGEGLELE